MPPRNYFSKNALDLFAAVVVAVAVAEAEAAVAVDAAVVIVVVIVADVEVVVFVIGRKDSKAFEFQRTLMMAQNY